MGRATAIAADKQRAAFPIDFTEPIRSLPCLKYFEFIANKLLLPVWGLGKFCIIVHRLYGRPLQAIIGATILLNVFTLWGETDLPDLFSRALSSACKLLGIISGLSFARSCTSLGPISLAWDFVLYVR